MAAAHAIPVRTVACYARASGGEVLVVLHVPGVSVDQGPKNLRLRQGKQIVWPDTTVAADSDGVRLEASAPAAAVVPGVWRVAVRRGGSEELTPVQARLVVAPGQPIAVLTGPQPRTVMKPPRPRSTPDPARSRRGAPELAARARAGLRRAAGRFRG